MMLTLVPSAAISIDPSSQSLYLVGSNPVYREKPNGEIIGTFSSGTVVDVLEIKGDWARIKYGGKEYYMWAPRLTKVSNNATNYIFTEKPFAPPNGWYSIETPSFSGKSTAGFIVIGDSGAEMDLSFDGYEYFSQRYFYVNNLGNNQVTLKMLNGKYLGISDPIKNGTRVKAVDTPYVWNTYTVSSLESASRDPLSTFISIRPSENTDMIINVSDWKLNEEGAHMILWSSKLGTVIGNAKLSWGGVKDPDKTFTFRDSIELLHNHVMKRMYPLSFSLSPSRGHFPPAATTPYKNYFWDGSGPNPYEGLKDASGNPRYDFADVPVWVSSLRM